MRFGFKPTILLNVFAVIVPFFLGAQEPPSERFIPSAPPVPTHNSQTKEKIELGRELFFDPRLSSTGTVSCNSCHNILHNRPTPPSGTDQLPVSVGVLGARGNRNAPTIWNASLRKALFWDGRAQSLEEQASGPIMNSVEMGMLSPASVEKAVQKIPGYPEKFRIAFSHPKQKQPYQVPFDEIVKAIAAFERTLVTTDSAFERFLRGDKLAMSKSAQNGWQKFQAHACIACHAAPTFTNQDYFIRFPLREAREYDQKYKFTQDEGRFMTTHQFKDRNTWRVPSLQNVAVTGPYFHNGSVESLEEAIRIMAKAQLGKTLPENDVKEIAEFLKSLTGSQLLQKTTDHE